MHEVHEQEQGQNDHGIGSDSEFTQELMYYYIDKLTHLGLGYGAFGSGCLVSRRRRAAGRAGVARQSSSSISQIQKILCLVLPCHASLRRVPPWPAPAPTRALCATVLEPTTHSSGWKRRKQLRGWQPPPHLVVVLISTAASTAILLSCRR